MNLFCLNDKRIAAPLLAILASGLCAQTIGTMEMSGDPKFDSGSLADSGMPERTWLSYPGARLTLNPASPRRFEIRPLAPNLPLDLGGYVGTSVVRLPGVLQMQAGDGQLASHQSTTWYPYKLSFQAEYANGLHLSGYDFFVDADSTVVRVIMPQGKAGEGFVLTGLVPERSRAHWDESKRALVVEGPNYSYALQFAVLSGSRLLPAPLKTAPALEPASWKIAVPAGPAAIGFGFATTSEGSAAAVARAAHGLSRPATQSVADTKARMDALLRRVPKPRKWGVANVPAFGITPERHRRAYYSAWALVLQSLMREFPENPSYPYPQMSLGKASLWAEGERTAPATCGWESLMGLQWLSFVEPDIAWRAYEGIMSRVDDKGKLGGESLPSRKAQTAWVLYQRLPDPKRLAAVYPSIKRYLLWREQNPRWIYGSHDNPEERDMEFVVSWLFDVGYAVRIAEVLGLPDDVKLWRSKTAPAIRNLRQWFFADPEKLHQSCFVKADGSFTTARSNGNPNMILTALVLRDLPSDMVERLRKLFLEIHDPKRANDGFRSTKYPDNNLDAYGLMDHRMPEAGEFVAVLLRDSIRAGEFAEALIADKQGNPEVEGVKPSLFTALNIIEFTWILNGVRYDSGTPAPLGLK